MTQQSYFSKISHFEIPAATHKYSVALNTMRPRRLRRVMALCGESYSDTANLLLSIQHMPDPLIHSDSTYSTLCEA